MCVWVGTSTYISVLTLCVCVRLYVLFLYQCNCIGHCPLNNYHSWPHPFHLSLGSVSFILCIRELGRHGGAIGETVVTEVVVVMVVVVRVVMVVVVVAVVNSLSIHFLDTDFVGKVEASYSSKVCHKAELILVV